MPRAERARRVSSLLPSPFQIFSANIIYQFPLVSVRHPLTAGAGVRFPLAPDRSAEGTGARRFAIANYLNHCLRAPSLVIRMAFVVSYPSLVRQTPRPPC